ncbi:MAG: hypothetical protein CM15mV134_090 [uncultured marine virus]|nr:MAG: hypothetical protein CM15mV134_090 [uncultured marine virus]
MLYLHVEKNFGSRQTTRAPRKRDERVEKSKRQN